MLDFLDTSNFVFEFGAITLTSIVMALIVLIVSFILIKILIKIITRALNKFNVPISLHSFIRSVAKGVLWFIAILIIADLFGVPIASLIAILGVAGLAVSLAIQGSLSNLAGGITTLISKPFVVGDYIETNSVSGTVDEIGLVYTKVKTIDNKLVFIPNSEISTSKITNYTAETLRRVDINVGASYDNSIDSVKNALMDAISKTDLILNDPPIFVNVNEYKNSYIDYVIRVWVKTADYWTVHFQLLEDIKHSFDQNGIQMTYDHINVHMIDK